MRPRNAVGFTLVELLVVIAIIAVLLALLVPAMDKAMAMAERAVCATHIRGSLNGLSQYAVENRSRTPEYWPGTGEHNFGIYSVWAEDATVHPVMGKYRGLGWLAIKQFIHPTILYCPSNRVTNLQYDKQNADGGGWPADNDPSGRGLPWIQIAYNLRATFTTQRNGAAPHRAANLSRDSGDEPLLADSFANPLFGSSIHHVAGYNFGRIDNSTDFLLDPEDILKYWFDGNSYHNIYRHSEKAFRHVFKPPEPHYRRTADVPN
jgi:prepilin-type N-terminal cleavage/methylation domain-containing protein